MLNQQANVLFQSQRPSRLPQEKEDARSGEKAINTHVFI